MGYGFIKMLGHFREIDKDSTVTYNLKKWEMGVCSLFFQELLSINGQELETRMVWFECTFIQIKTTLRLKSC
jgi:hypothetical protein